MAHEISFNKDGKPEFAYADEAPWHGLGVAVPHKMTPIQALRIANLEWDAVLKPAYFAGVGLGGPGKMTEVPDRKVVVRSDDNRYLGTVGLQFTPIQNKEVAEFIEALCGEAESVVEVVGALRNGSRVFYTVKVNGRIAIHNGDTLDKYLIVCNGHDGSLSMRAFWSFIRVVCMNTLKVALHRKDAADGVVIRHTTKVANKVEEARRVLGLANTYYDEAVEVFKGLVGKIVTDQIATEFYEKLIPNAETEMAQKNVLAIRDTLFTNFRTGKGAEMAGRTAWGLFNSVTEYASHQKRVGSPDRRFETLLLAGRNTIAQDAFDLVQKVA